jgi:hypothetical protein
MCVRSWGLLSVNHITLIGEPSRYGNPPEGRGLSLTWYEWHPRLQGIEPRTKEHCPIGHRVPRTHNNFHDDSRNPGELCPRTKQLMRSLDRPGSNSDDQRGADRPSGIAPDQEAEMLTKAPCECAA